MARWRVDLRCVVRVVGETDEKNSPLFVTWNVRPSRPGRGHRLRGCIGSFEPHALHEGIAEYALISAFKDYRFNKITKGELDSLECV
jgi:AMMECR1 domain-containing protein